MSRLKEIIEKLPPDLQKEVVDFAEYLLKKQTKKHGKLRMNWAGALREYRDQFTSLELQKKSLQWWGD